MKVLAVLRLQFQTVRCVGNAAFEHVGVADAEVDPQANQGHGGYQCSDDESGL